MADLSAASAWQVFGEGFADWASWSDGITSSVLDRPVCQGAIRTNDTPILGVVTQELTEFDREGRSLTYEMRSGLPAPIKAVKNRWTIEPVGDDRCKLSGVAEFTLACWAVPLTPVLRKKMTGALKTQAEDFNRHVSIKP